MVRCRTNTVEMYVKRGFSNRILVVKTHYYSYKQLIVHGKVDHSILVMKTKSFAISMYKRRYKPGHCIKDMKYNHDISFIKYIFMVNDAFIDVFVMGLDSAAIAIVDIQLHSIGDMEDQLTIRLRSMRSSRELFAL